MPKNGFNFLRLVFALFVVITHSYPLSGAPDIDYLKRVSGGQVSFSFLGLSGFFIISGYLVFQSLDRSNNLLVYFRKRVLRIFPGLFVMLLLTVLLGVFVYEGTFQNYIGNPYVWTYLPSNLLLVKSQGIIPGIFTNNPYNPTINGSLWSILYEFSFYIALAALFFFKRRAQILITASVLALMLAGKLFWANELSVYRYILELRLVLEYGPFFAFGALLAMIGIKQNPGNNLIIALLTFALVAVIYFRVFDEARFFILPPLVILAGLSPMTFLQRALDKLGDISYGIYIYAFPLQQTLVHFFRLDAMELMAWSVVLSSLLGYFSWHCIEKYALRLK